MDPVIIVGMHRSGTSMLTRMLAEAGLFVGRDVERHHESRFFIGLNRWILRTAGAAWDDPDPVMALARDDQACDAMACHLDARLGHVGNRGYLGALRSLTVRDPRRLGRVWGWKDPRNCLTLPWWSRVVPGARIVYIRRHGVDVAASLVARYGRLRDDMRARPGSYWKWPGKPVVPRRGASGLGSAFKLWERYDAAARSMLPAFEHRSVRFEDLDAGRVADLCDFLGLAKRPSEAIDPSRTFAFERKPELRAFAEEHAASLRAAGY